MKLRGLLLLSCAPSALAWGAVGHEVVATIAQIHLHPSAMQALKALLPNSQGHLAPIAAWADRIRGIPALSWTSTLHYTSPTMDHPPDACYFGEKGWKSDRNVLTAISNFTQKLVDNPHDGLAIRLLVHFIGDAHQPLHLTDRERGGNGDPVIFERRRMSLHSLWDGGLIAKGVRELSNYTRPLPSRQIEDALRGTIYDSYIRLILWEGVRIWWRSDLSAWLACPSTTASVPSSQLILTKSEAALADTVCPEHWARETHAITCSLVYPEGYDNTAPPVEVNTPEYYGPIRDGNVIEKLLAQAGLRLAASLNAIFATTEELALGEVRDWMIEADDATGVNEAIR